MTRDSISAFCCVVERTDAAFVADFVKAGVASDWFPDFFGHGMVRELEGDWGD